jgi:hypothetical protein
MFQDYKHLLSVFNAHSVKYLIVGGYAVSFHAQPHATKDIELFIKADAANAKATYAALASFGSLDNIRVEDLADQRNFIRFGREPRAVDILPGIDGVEFDAAWERRVEGIIDPKSGLTAFFISSVDLMAAKLAAGRPQDIADVAALSKAAETQTASAKNVPRNRTDLTKP